MSKRAVKSEYSKYKRLISTSRVIEILRAYAGVDWQLASLACKVICNFLSFDGYNEEEDEEDEKQFSVFELLGQEGEAELESLLMDLIGALSNASIVNLANH